nr:PilW family protein [Uliginosibacterium gangwonense]
MVAMVISMILLFAVYQVLTFAEGRKRTTTSINDINQTGAYNAQLIDTIVRQAGSGFAPLSSYAYGCALSAKKNGANLFPATTLPAPFTNVKPTGTAGEFRLSPILIVPDATTPGISGQPSDVLVVMSGTASLADMPINVSVIPVNGSTAVSLDSTAFYKPNDLLLVSDVTGATTTTVHPCSLEQVSSTFDAAASPTSLPFAGTYAQALQTSFTEQAVVSNIGNVVGNNPPTFMLLGVGDNNTLYSFDLLKASSDSPSIITDGVFEMHALYGVDLDGDGKVDSWFSPKVPDPVSASYGTKALMDGSITAVALLSNIKAIRLGMIFRTSLQETSAADSTVPACTAAVAGSAQQNGCVSPASIVLFNGLKDPANRDLSVTRTFTSAERIYRYRTVDVVIPLRNNLL